MKKLTNLLWLLLAAALLFSCKNKKSEPDYTETLDAIEDSLDRVDSIQRVIDLMEAQAKADSAARADSIRMAELDEFESEIEQIEADDAKKNEAGLADSEEQTEGGRENHSTVETL